MRLEPGSSAALHTVSFRDNIAGPAGPGAAAPGGPALGLLTSPPSSVWLQGCSFAGSESDTVGDVAVEASTCAVFSDQRERPTVWDAQSQVTMTPQWLEFGSSGMRWGPPADQREFLNEADDWVTAARLVRPPGPDLSHPVHSMPYPSQGCCRRMCHHIPRRGAADCHTMRAVESV